MNAVMPVLGLSPWKILKTTTWRARIKFLRAGFRFMLNPERTEELFTIDDIFLDTPPATQQVVRDYVAQFMHASGMEPLFNERYLPKAADLDQLIKLPAGTLGHEFASHMKRYNLSVDFYPQIEVTDEKTYISMRFRQTHDIFHVLTGFGTSIPDELGVQAFVTALINSPMSVGIIGGGLMRSVLFDPAIQHECMMATMQGYQMGLGSRGVLSYRYEDNWAKPLSEIRSELGVSTRSDTMAA